jgi:hypothetical protein
MKNDDKKKSQELDDSQLGSVTGGLNSTAEIEQKKAEKEYPFNLNTNNPK